MRLSRYLPVVWVWEHSKYGKHLGHSKTHGWYDKLRNEKKEIRRVQLPRTVNLCFTCTRMNQEVWPNARVLAWPCNDVLRRFPFLCHYWPHFSVVNCWNSARIMWFQNWFFPLLCQFSNANRGVVIAGQRAYPCSVTHLCCAKTDLPARHAKVLEYNHRFWVTVAIGQPQNDVRCWRTYGDFTINHINELVKGSWTVYVVSCQFRRE